MINKLKYYFKLSKVFLSIAVSVSAVIGYFISKEVNLSILVQLFFGVFFLSCSAGAINQIQEYKNDSIMNRTKNRPLPQKNILPKSAIVFSSILFIIGFTFLLKLNYYCAILGLLNLVIYNFIYTPLKYKTNFALLAGGLVGAIPPFIGWFVNYSYFKSEIILFSAFMFVWQIPHFWIILLKHKNDYNKVKIKNILNITSLYKLKLLLFIWILTSSVVSLFFPILGLLNNYTNFIILFSVNIFIIISFIKILFFSEKLILTKIPNIFLHFYLLVIFSLILLGSI